MHHSQTQRKTMTCSNTQRCYVMLNQTPYNHVYVCIACSLHWVTLYDMWHLSQSRTYVQHSAVCHISTQHIRWFPVRRISPLPQLINKGTQWAMSWCMSYNINSHSTCIIKHLSHHTKCFQSHLIVNTYALSQLLSIVIHHHLITCICKSHLDLITYVYI